MRVIKGLQVACIFFLLLVGGCNSDMQPAPTASGGLPFPSGASGTAGAITTASLTSMIYTTKVGATVVPILIPTDTPAPTETPTAIPPTWTPLPTLSREEAQEFVMDLLETNAGCDLPCYWGIVPGETTREKAEHFFSSFTDRIGQGGNSITKENGIKLFQTVYSIYNRIAGYSDYVSSHYSVTNGIIEGIVVKPRGTELRYQLHQVLERYGTPEEVLIYAEPDSPKGTPIYWMVLFYPQKGIMAFYEGDARSQAGKIQICSKGSGPELTLLPAGEMSLDEMERTLLDLNVRAIMKSINKVMEIEDFSKKMRIPGSCIMLPPF